MKINIQKHCEVLETLLNRDVLQMKLSGEEFTALNAILRYAQSTGDYFIKEEVLH